MKDTQASTMKDTQASTMEHTQTKLKLNMHYPSGGWQFLAAIILIVITHTTVSIDGVRLFTIPDKLSLVLNTLVVVLLLWDLRRSFQYSKVVKDEHNCRVKFNGYTVDLFLCEDQKTLGLTVEHKRDDTSTDLFINEHLQVSPTAAA